MVKNRFKAGQRIKVRGTPNKGVIVEVLEDFKDIGWQGKLPQFIVVQLDGGVMRLAHPSQLKGTTK